MLRLRSHVPEYITPRCEFGKPFVWIEIAGKPVELKFNEHTGEHIARVKPGDYYRIHVQNNGLTPFAYNVHVDGTPVHKAGGFLDPMAQHADTHDIWDSIYKSDKAFKIGEPGEEHLANENAGTVMFTFQKAERIVYRGEQSRSAFTVLDGERTTTVQAMKYDLERVGEPIQVTVRFTLSGAEALAQALD